MGVSKYNAETSEKDILTKAGFIINEDKSLKIPFYKMFFLGFEIESVKMVVSLPHFKRREFFNLRKVLLKGKILQIEKLAVFLGNLLLVSLPLN